MAEQSSDKPVIFNEQEQLQLQNLQKQGEDFTAWKTAMTRSLHSGQDSILVANLIQFLQNLIQQVAQQIELVTANAKRRIADEAKAKTETPKAN